MDKVVQIRMNFHKKKRLQKLCEIGKAIQLNYEPPAFLKIGLLEMQPKESRNNTSLSYLHNSPLLQDGRKKLTNKLSGSIGRRSSGEFNGFTFLTDNNGTLESKSKTFANTAPVTPSSNIKVEEEVEKQKQRFERFDNARDERQLERSSKILERTRRAEQNMKEYEKRLKEIQSKNRKKFG